MLISQELRIAAEQCYMRAFPFAISFMPSSDNPRFFACEKAVSPDQTLDNYFLIGCFGGGASQRPQAIVPQFSAADIFSMSRCSAIIPTEEITAQSTGIDEYRQVINNVVSDLRGLDAKVVIARQIVAESTLSPLDIAEKYFNQFPACMRSIFYTPQTGVWITATPELLIDYSLEAGELHTMSLAGTRRTDVADWDLKNNREHELVTEYIVSVLEDFGMDVEISDSENLVFGEIEHLCNRIKATGKIDPVKLAIQLSPTPAVGGWPVDYALESIARYENFDRGCYGGFLGVVSRDRCRLFVNLRCCHLLSSHGNNYRWRLFAGGGITNMSDADAEWAEAENKISPLRNILTDKNFHKLNSVIN